MTTNGFNYEIVFAFDRTGSMYPCIGQLKRIVASWTKLLFARVHRVRVGYIDFGDYCDAPNVINHHPLSTDVPSLTRYVDKVQASGGGDAPECYELALHESRAMGWTAGAKKVVVIIGDEEPHAVSYPGNTQRLDWRNEVKMLLEAGVQVFGVQALGKRHARPFYEGVAQLSGGQYLQLDQFREIGDILLAICFSQVSPDELTAWEQEVEREGRMSRGFDRAVSVLSGRPVRFAAEPSYASASGWSSSRLPSDEVTRLLKTLERVPPSRFQVLDVDARCDIRGFVESNGLIFKAGYGFYELVKTEDLRKEREIILRHDATGDLFTGRAIRDIVGVPWEFQGRISPSDIPAGYTAFVESTSYNRKLDGPKHGRPTKFMYEVDLSK